MMLHDLTEILVRDLNTLKKEIELYDSGKVMWSIAPGINNSGGNLCLHLIGNLNHFIGAALGNTGYKRNRHAEFGDKNIPKEKLLGEIDGVIQIIRNVVPNLSEEKLEANFPVPIFQERVKTGFFLIFLLGHLNYHIGQINYHRRILST